MTWQSRARSEPPDVAYKMFTIDDRNRVRDRVLQMAGSDPRVVAGAVVGSLARGEGDRWSDLDLTFAVRDGVPVVEVLEDWTRRVRDEFAAAHLFDLPRGTSIYRVFLLPGCLQFDLSFTPAADFGALGPEFRLLFGVAVEKPHPEAPSVRMLFGYAVHHALRARLSIERGRCWRAEYWISGVRDHALTLACCRLGLPPHYGKGFDDLPRGVRDAFAGALVASPDPDELDRALGCVIDGLLAEAAEVPGLATGVEHELRMIRGPWDRHSSRDPG